MYTTSEMPYSISALGQPLVLSVLWQEVLSRGLLVGRASWQVPQGVLREDLLEASCRELVQPYTRGMILAHR